MRIFTTLLAALLLTAAACTPGDDDNTYPDYGWDFGADADADDGAPPYDGYETPDMSGFDSDGDGFTPATGDCDDSEANINPNAFEVPDNLRDDDCNGETDEAPPECDCLDWELPHGLDLCDGRFLLDSEYRHPAPGSENGAGVYDRYGDAANDLAPRFGCTYTILATAPVDIADCDPELCPSGHRQPGTDYYYDGWLNECETSADETDPAPGSSDGALICDLHQIVLHLKAPANANGFSFDFLYLSAEYPEWLDQGFNDTFYAIIDRPSTGELLNISYDEGDHEIEVDSAFFEDPPTTNIAGTGYDGMCTNEDFTRTVCGSSTGWLRTSWGVNPNEEFTLTFSIHDEGDGLYDSATLIDNFVWSPNPVDPGTIII